MKPIYIHSGMAGAPQYANANDSINGILEACLVNGFNSHTATSASASGGILTLNFASNPGFEALQTVEVAVADVALVNGKHRVIANANNQVTIAIAGLPDGAVGSSGAGITIKQAGAGWSKPFSASTKAVFRPPAGNRRYLRCVHAANGDFTARGYENMTSIDDGDGLFPSLDANAAAIVVNNAYYNPIAGAAWFLICTDKWVFFSLAQSNVDPYSLGALFFCDLAHAVKPADFYSTFISTLGTKNINRNYVGATLSMAATLRTELTNGAAWPGVIDGGFTVIPYVPVFETGNVMRGVLPNTYKLIPNAPILNFMGIYDNINGVVGRVKLITFGYVGGATFEMAIAIDEEAWD